MATSMAEQRIPVTIVNHVALDIACAPEIVWDALLADYVEARKFSAIGYSIEPLQDRTAYLGAYTLRFEKDGALLDHRICRVTELNRSERRLSMAADYLCVPGGMTVRATYQAQEGPAGARLAIDCHADLAMEWAAAGTREELAAAVETITAQYDAGLIGYLESVKATLEGRG